MAKSKYVPGKKLASARFDSPDKQERLTVVLSEGKGKFNIKASIKEMKEDAEKARTGARESFDSQEKGKKAFEMLTKEAVEQGWSEVKGGGRSAFSSIPAPSGAKKGGKK